MRMCQHIEMLNWSGAIEYNLLRGYTVEDATCDSSNFKRIDEKLMGRERESRSGRVREIPSNKYIFQQQYRNLLFRIGAEVMLIALASLFMCVPCVRYEQQQQQQQKSVYAKTETPSKQKMHRVMLRTHCSIR